MATEMFKGTLYIPPYENDIYPHSYLDNWLLSIFKNTFSQYELSKFILNYIQKSTEGLVYPTELYKNIKVNKTTLYKTINKLKTAGMIRKEGRCYRLNSTFSFELIKVASDWVNFAKIKTQKNDLIKTLLEV